MLKAVNVAGRNIVTQPMTTYYSGGQSGSLLGIGDVIWLDELGRPHRLDGPAIERADGRKEWWQNGKRHRTDGPAIEWADGEKYWYQNGKRHRLDGPAVEWADGSKSWWISGICYRSSNKFCDSWYWYGRRYLVVRK